LLKLAAYFRCPDTETLSCATKGDLLCRLIRSHRWHRSTWETWLSCPGVEELFSYIECVLGQCYMLAISNLSGDLITYIPEKIEDLTGFLSKTLEIPSRSEIEIETDSTDPHIISQLLSISSKITLYKGSQRALLQVRERITTETLFDLGLRLLKPKTIPPKPKIKNNRSAKEI